VAQAKTDLFGFLDFDWLEPNQKEFEKSAFG
jgi:hypothetical protein